MSAGLPAMPLETLVDAVCDLNGSDYNDGYEGVFRNTFDSESGVLTLSFDTETQEQPGEHGPAEARFVEVEKLIETLGKITEVQNQGPRPWGSPEWWRLVLSEKLDAHKL